MNVEITPTLAVMVSGIMTGVVTPCVAFFITEYKLQRQRRWDAEDRQRLANEAKKHLEAVHLDVQRAGAKADAAYTAANAVNLWRNELTELLSTKQDDLLEVAKDTNCQVKLARSVFLMPALVDAAKQALPAKPDK